MIGGGNSRKPVFGFRLLEEKDFCKGLSLWLLRKGRLKQDFRRPSLFNKIQFNCSQNLRSQPADSTLYAFSPFITAALALCIDFQRWYRNRLTVFNGNHGEVAAVGMTHFTGADVLRFYTDADFHRSAAGVVNAGVKGYQFADMDRLFKQNFIDRQGNAVVAAVSAGTGISDLVEQAQ